MNTLTKVFLAFFALILILSPAFAEDFDALARKCAPTVAVDTLRAIVKTESGFKPLAIGVVGGAVKQPETLQDAVLSVTKLVAEKRSFSVGLAQINSGNFDALGLSAEELFDPCTNLKAAAVILGKCYERMTTVEDDPAKALADTLSCYYSGNAKTGYEHGYVDKVIANAPALQIPSIRILTATQSSVPQAANLITSSVNDQKGLVF